MSYAHGGGERQFLPVNIAVLTVSDSRDEQTDKSGRLLVERLTRAGHRLAEKLIVPDDVYRLRAAVSRWIAQPEVNVVITTGGTGVTGRDGTPALAGVANGTYVFCVPGSSGACATAWDALIEAQLDLRTRPCNLVELMPRLRET